MTGYARFAGAFVLASAVCVAPAIAQESPVLGAWDTKVESPMGEFAAKWTFTDGQDGLALDIEPVAPEGGAAAGPGGGAAPEMAVSDLVIEDASFSFTQSVTTPQGDMAIAVTGTVAGDALSAQANTDFGAMPISGTRSGE